jgi:hypothetical protein
MDFPGYQRPEIVTAQINALYDTLKFDYNLSYLSAPPKYELGATQNILFPHMVIEQEQGCCIDLAILFASCIERVGLDPVIFITTGHAFPGFFQGSLIERLETKESIWENGITESFDDVYKLVKDGHLVPFEASSIYNISFQEAKDDILNYGKLERENFKTALDISYLHKIGVTPLLT